MPLIGTLLYHICTHVWTLRYEKGLAKLTCMFSQSGFSQWSFFHNSRLIRQIQENKNKMVSLNFEPRCPRPLAQESATLTIAIEFSLNDLH